MVFVCVNFFNFLIFGGVGVGGVPICFEISLHLNRQKNQLGLKCVCVTVRCSYVQFFHLFTVSNCKVFLCSVFFIFSQFLTLASFALSELLHVYTPSRTLRSSSDTRMLEIQQYKRKTHGFRTFSCFGPHIWNSLPQDLRHCATLSSFKAKLKTFLFSQYFHPN